MKKRALFLPLLSALCVAVACTPKDDPEGGSTGGELLEGDYGVSEDIASIPCPPDSMRWVLNDEYSDEFNGTALDKDKWYDYHPSWVGREPGIFLKSQVSVVDGNLVLTGAPMDQDTILTSWNGGKLTYNIRCAAVVSKKQTAHYGYYECCFKANKTTLSTTFWLSTRENGNKPTTGRQPEGAMSGIFSQELDICETIGRNGNFGGSSIADGMNSNIHYWFTPTGKDKLDLTTTVPKLKREDGRKPSDDYNIYGCWWKDEKTASFYLNNDQETDFIDFKTNYKEVKDDAGNVTDTYPSMHYNFTESMGVNLVMETYGTNWIEAPNKEELADPTKNKSYYDWVRHYVLVPFDEELANPSATVVFDNHIHFNKRLTNHRSVDGKLSVPFSYTAAADSEIEFALIDKDEKVVASQKIAALAGYGNYEAFAIDASALSVESRYFLVANIRPAGAADNSASYEEDSFQFKYLGEK